MTGPWFRWVLCLSGSLFPNAPAGAASLTCSMISDAAQRLACYDKKFPPKPFGSDSTAGWEINRKKDAMTDRDSCVLSPVGRRYIQITPGELYISYRTRGGVASFQYRIDEGAASEMKLPSEIEKQISAVHIGGNEFLQVMGGSRLRLSTFTVLSTIIEEDIDTAGAKPLYAKMLIECKD